MKNFMKNKVVVYGIGSIALGSIGYKLIRNGLKKYPVNPKRARKAGAY